MYLIQVWHWGTFLKNSCSVNHGISNKHLRGKEWCLNIFYIKKEKEKEKSSNKWLSSTSKNKKNKYWNTSFVLNMYHRNSFWSLWSGCIFHFSYVLFFQIIFLKHCYRANHRISNRHLQGKKWWLNIFL